MVLYSLPELDGAIDAVPLGGLVGDDIFLVPERVTRLASRLHKWVAFMGLSFGYVLQAVQKQCILRVCNTQCVTLMHSL